MGLFCYFLSKKKHHFCVSISVGLYTEDQNSHRKLNMSMYKDTKPAAEEGPIHRIRITLTSRNVKSLEKVCTDLIKGAKDKELRVKGPVRMPTKTLRITTRKTPCGEDSKTWDRYQMRIHKRVIEFVCGQSQILNITQVQLEPGVHVELTLPEQ